MEPVQKTIATGIESVFSYGNIAVSVLFICLVGSAVMNYIMYRDGRKAQDRSAEAMITVRDMIGQVNTTLALINAKIKS